MPWIEERVKAFLPLIEPLGVTDEVTIERLCEQEIETWRARGLAQASLNSPMTAMRNGIKGIALTDANSWRNPRTQEHEHIALKYMNFSKEEWDRIKASTKKTVLSRMEQQQFLDQPEEFVRIASALLEQQSWPELAVGVLAVSGRRLSEGLYTAQFRRETDYTVLFTGQLKQPLADLCYEIPTLVPAPLLLSAVDRLRHHHALKDCSALTLNQISHRYGPKVRETAREAFEQVLPARAGKKQIAAHDLRAAYARIAVHWFCPPAKSDRLYAATILGHVQAAASEEEAFERMASEEHYADYLIGDGNGNQNGAKGTKLGDPGVVILKAFQPQSAPPPDTVEREKGEMQGGGTKKKKRAARPTFHVDPQTHERVSKRKTDLKLSSMNDVIVHLLDQSEALERSHELISPERLGLPAEVIEKIALAMERTHEQDFQDFLKKALVKEANMRIGTAQRYKDVDLTTFPTSQLEKQQKSPALAQERIRRAVITLMRYNQQQADPKLRASLTQNAVHDLVGGRFDHIREFLQKHREVIAHHHSELEVTEKRSSKVKLSELVIPEDPEEFQKLFLSEPPERSGATKDLDEQTPQEGAMPDGDSAAD